MNPFIKETYCYECNKEIESKIFIIDKRPYCMDCAGIVEFREHVQKALSQGKSLHDIEGYEDF